MTQLGFAITVLVAIATTGVMTHRNSVIRFHQDEGTYAQQKAFKPEHPDRGYIKNCGPGGGYFNVSWSPKEVDPTRQIRFFAGLVSPVSFSKGRLTGTLWYEENPMMSVDKEVGCDEIAKFIAKNLPSYALHIDCPIKKGQRFDGYYVFPNTDQLIGYDGNYKLKAELKSETGEQLLCIEIELTVKAF
ncbi:uncharacterized protein [Littorina saxatilis]|uniref:MD-2-related lipid-recognition domain-containing protein n=1 Tax=Littorina saxatilis TaxID=31220 RepID=A0AAN9AJP3_9CAEN